MVQEVTEEHLCSALRAVLHRHVVLQEGCWRCHVLLPLGGCPCAAHAAQHPLHHLDMAFLLYTSLLVETPTMSCSTLAWLVEG